MRDGWMPVSLRDITAKIGSGATPRGGKEVYQETGTALIRSQNVYDNRFSFSGLAFISQSAAAALAGVTVNENDVLINITGESVTRTCIVDPAALPARVNQHVAIVRPDPKRLEPGFLKAALLSPSAKARLNALSSAGATRRALTKHHLERFTIVLPPPEEQRRIAGVLGALDDLIDTNRQIALNCSMLWHAAVDDALNQANETVPLSDLAQFINGKNFTKGASGVGRAVIRTPEVRHGPQSATVRSDIKVRDENLARPGDIMFVWSGSLTVNRWAWEEGLVNQHVFKVIPKSSTPAWLVYALIERQMPWFLGLAANQATTMGHIKREHLNARVPLPSRTEIARLNVIVTPLWDEALQCQMAAEHLGRARDELLPLLVSGRVRVRESVGAV